MRLSELISGNCCDAPKAVETVERRTNTQCGYCPALAVSRFVTADEHTLWFCTQHEKTARRDYEASLRRPRRRLAATQQVEAVIRKVGNEWCVKSPSNPDWSGGCYGSKEKAKKRLKQIEFFKHKGGSVRGRTRYLAHYDEAGGWSIESNVTGVKYPRTSHDHPNRSAGILFLCQGRVLLVKRAHDEKSPSRWSIPGGHIKLTFDRMPRDPWGNAVRECKEEMGSLPPGTGRATRRHRYTSKSGKIYTTFIVELPPGAMKWRPKLAPDHVAYRWCNRDQVKALKLHPNIKRVLNNPDVWEQPFYTTVNIVMEREAQLGKLMQDKSDVVVNLNHAARTIYSQMTKDFQFMRLELTEVVHGPPGYKPVSGVSGVFRTGTRELYFRASISPREGNYRVLFSTRIVGFRRAATFRSAKGMTKWILTKLLQAAKV